MMLRPTYIVGVVGLIVGLAGGAGLAMRHFEPRLAAANHRAGELENAYLTLAAAAGRQNAAIEALRVGSDRRKLAALAAATRANRQAQTYYDKGATLLGVRPPPGADPCRAARDAFDAELTEERQK